MGFTRKKQLIGCAFTLGKEKAIPIKEMFYIRNRGQEITPIMVCFMETKENESDIKAIIKSNLKTDIDLYAIEGSTNNANFQRNIGSFRLADGELIKAQSQKLEHVKGNFTWFVNPDLVGKMISIDIDEDNESGRDVVRSYDDLTKNEQKKFRDEVLRIITTSYPYPLEEAWLDFFVENVAKNTRIEVVNSIYSDTRVQSRIFFLFDLRVEDGAQFIPLSYGMSRFKKLFGRVPMVPDICLMINPNKFKVKTFQSFLQSFGGRDEFLKLSPQMRETYVYGYEVFGEKLEEVQELLYKNGIDFSSLSLKGTAIKLSREREINSDLIVKGLRVLINYFNENQNQRSRFKQVAIYAFLSKMHKIDNLQELINKPSELINVIKAQSYTVRPGAENVAEIAAELWMSQEEYEEYEKLYLDAANSPKGFLKVGRAIPTKRITIDSQYSAEYITIEDPRSMFVGLETNCCQHLGSAGSSCVRYMASHPETSGIFRVMKNGSTVAQSFVWFHQDSGVVCCDNIEVLGGEIRDQILQAYIKFGDEILEPYANIFGYTALTVGLGYNDLDEISRFPRVESPITLNMCEDGESIYSDAGSQRTIKTFRSRRNAF